MAVKCILTGQTPSVLDGVTENVQTQIDNKQDKITITGILQGDGQGNITAVESIGAEVVTLNKSDVGLGNVDNVQQYSESNPPPYPVTSVNSKSGVVTLSASDVGAIATVENLTVSDSLSYTMTDGTIKAGFQKIDNDTHMVLVGYSNVEDRCVGLFVRPNSDYAQISVGFYNQSNGDMDIANPAVTFTNLANPLINTDAANKAYVDTSVQTKQSKITASGILKGDGTGTVTAAEEAEVELVDITPASIGAASKEYVDSVATGTTLSVTLASASWTGDAVPYTYTISNSAITAISTQELSPATDITADQLSALQAANIIDGGQAAGSMTLKAFGEKPSVDIPVRIIVKG